VAPRQYYTTTIFDPDGAGEATFIVAPKSAFAEQELGERPESIGELFGAAQMHRVSEAFDIWPALAVVLAEDQGAIELLEKSSPEEWLQALARVAPSAKRGFASYCASAPVVPFEESPLIAASLVSLISKATPTAAGALVGFIVAGPSPLALIVMPAGMIVFGTASGVARGLQEGLADKIKKALGASSDD
jgi:hypothetical protein